ncbi:hypothetical protein K503DRAFT_670756, partial [Rhizopogon vinicolor AM-OR11-026]
YVTFMADHINTRSAGNNISGICSQLKEFYPYVRINLCSRLVLCTFKPVQCKLPLPSPPSHDDILFMAQLLYGFHGLLRLDELVVPDNTKLRVHGKLTLRMSVSLADSHYSFVLYSHKTDVNFKGDAIAIQQVVEADFQGTFLNYLIYLDRLFPVYSTLLVLEDGSMPSHPWLISRLHQFFPLGHSLRAGGVISLAASGVPAAQIQTL